MYPEDKLFDIYRISKPNIKEKSIKQYITVFKQYHKKVSGKDTFDWADWEWIKFQPKFLDDVNVPSTRRNYYNCIIPILLSLGMTTPPEFIEKHGKITGIENLNILEEQSKYRLAVINNNNETKKMAENNIISDKKLEKYKVKFSEIKEFVNELRSKEKFQDSLILFLMTEYLFRNEISQFKWIPLKSFNKMDETNKSIGNYIVIGSKKMFISRAEFKTVKTHGRTESSIINNLLKSDIKKYIKTLDDDIMFKNSNNEIYTNDSLSQKLGRLTKEKFGVSLGTSSINSLYLETLDKETIKKLMALSTNRGTSLGVLLTHYYNDIH
tara:strand:- start:289 stop:1263 length:975 start_codon:yes stop_codon:yes gene_type:complete